MSNQPTVGTLAAKAIELNAHLNDDMARAFIRTNNIRSMSKLETLVNEQLKDKTEDELKALIPVEAKPAAKPKADAKPAATKPATKPEAKKPAAKTAPKAETKPKFERKGREKRATAVNEGPRGFRFGPVWNNSVIAGEGVAMLDIHKNKLLKQAESLGINRFTAADDSAKIAKAIAPKVQAQMEAGAAS
jgi:hypothetical protein